MKRKIRAVFADIDGTLYSHETGMIPPSALGAIQKAKEKGVLVFAATGRHMLEIRDLGIELKPDGWITLNGALCFSGKEIFHKDPVAKEDIAVLLEVLEEVKFPVQFMEKDLMYINMDDEAVRKALSSIHTPYPLIIDPKRALDHDTYMIIPWVKEEIWSRAFQKMKHLKYTRWNDLAVDAMNIACGKKNGVLAACAYYGIDPAETMAIGDGPNDVELFEACGLSIAMGNSEESVKKAADEVTGHIDQDGFAEAFEKYIFD